MLGWAPAQRTAVRIPWALVPRCLPKLEQESPGTGPFAIITVNYNRVGGQERVHVGCSENAMLKASRKAFWKKQV